MEDRERRESMQSTLEEGKGGQEISITGAGRLAKHAKWRSWDVTSVASNGLTDTDTASCLSQATKARGGYANGRKAGLTQADAGWVVQ